MSFKCKCEEIVSTYDVFYEENGKFKAYYYQCPVCGCCQIVVHYADGKTKIIKGFKR